MKETIILNGPKIVVVREYGNHLFSCILKWQEFEPTGNFRLIGPQDQIEKFRKKFYNMEKEKGEIDVFDRSS